MEGMMDTITLNWYGPYLFSQLIADAQLRERWDVPGVYLWIDRRGPDSTLSYVGKAAGPPALWRRQLQHYMSYIGGSYVIPKYARISGIEWSLDVKRPGVVDTILDYGKFISLVREGYDYANNIEIYLAETNKSLVHILERILLYELCPTQTEWRTQNAPKERLQVMHAKATWASGPIRAQIRKEVEFVL
jgi:hypothetical protein